MPNFFCFFPFPFPYAVGVVTAGGEAQAMKMLANHWWLCRQKMPQKPRKKIRALERELLNQDRAKRKAEGFATQSWKMRSEQKKRLERKKKTTFTQKQEYLLHLVTQWYDKKKKKPSSILICVISPRGKQPVWWSYFSLEEEKPWNLEKLSVKQCYSTDLTGIAILGDPGISVHWQEDLQQCKTW